MLAIDVTYASVNPGPKPLAREAASRLHRRNAAAHQPQLTRRLTQR